jgi:hypothetical protein
VSRVVNIGLLTVALGCSSSQDSDSDDEDCCDLKGNTQFGEEDDSGSSGHCEETGSASLALTDDTPLGVTGQTLVDLVEGAREASLSWGDGETSALTISASANLATLVLVSRTWVGDDDGECEPLVRFRATVRLHTADGALAESSTDTLTAWSADEIAWEAWGSELSGSADLTVYVDEGEQVTGIGLENTWRTDGVSGAISLEARGSGAVSLMRIASW